MILVNGDSITYGDGLLENEKSWPNLVFKDTEFKNIAQSGSSNPSIFRRTLEEIYLNQYTAVVVAWSSMYRFEWADNHGKAKTFLLGSQTSNRSAAIIIKELTSYWNSEFWYFKQFLLTLSNLQLHCNKLGIKLYCLTAFPDLSNCYSTTYTNYINFHKTINLNLYPDSEIHREFDFLNKLIYDTNECWILPPIESLTDLYGDHKISATDSHPNQIGHQKIANRLAALFKLKLNKYTKLE